jgi:hypothetical protein
MAQFIKFLGASEKKPLRRNYDYGESPYSNVPSGGKKSIVDLARKHRKSKIYAIAAEVLDITQKLENKQRQTEQQETKKKFEESTPENLIAPTKDELGAMREQKFLQEVQQQSGIWMHRFSDIRKDNSGFYILKQDNAAGAKMAPGHLLADYAVNMTPYWKIISVDGNRINLEPIGPNPFLTGVGAGGAKLTDFDVSVFTGEYEKDKVKETYNKIQNGSATIDDVVYLLDGTVPTNMGPNGAQGGWYNSSDRSSRGGRSGMTAEQIMISDAKKLVDFGFSGIPVKALSGELDSDDWDNWISGRGEVKEYIPKDLEAYVDFHRKMTEKGRWKYDEDALDELRRKHSAEHMEKHWEKILNDFISIPKEEFKKKYPYYPETLNELIKMSRQYVENVEKKIEQQNIYQFDGDETEEENVIKNVFHKERRVSIRNTLRLINMVMEDPKYIKYLHDTIRLGGTDWYANEKIINFFENIDDIDGLKLAAENLKDSDNLKYAYRALIDGGESEFVINRLNDKTPLDALTTAIYNYRKQLARESEYIDWLIKFVNDNNIFAIIDSKTVNKEDYFNRYHAEELLSVMKSPFKYMNREELSPYISFINEIDNRIRALKQ